MPLLARVGPWQSTDIMVVSTSYHCSIPCICAYNLLHVIGHVAVLYSWHSHNTHMPGCFSLSTIKLSRLIDQILCTIEIPKRRGTTTTKHAHSMWVAKQNCIKIMDAIFRKACMHTPKGYGGQGSHSPPSPLPRVVSSPYSAHMQLSAGCMHGGLHASNVRSNNGRLKDAWLRQREHWLQYCRDMWLVCEASGTTTCLLGPRGRKHKIFWGVNAFPADTI